MFSSHQLSTPRQVGELAEQLIDIGTPGAARFRRQIPARRPGQTQHQVVRRQRAAGMTKSLARQTLQQIALNRSTRQLLGNDQADPRAADGRRHRRPRREVMQIEIFAAQGAPRGEYQGKVGSGMQSVLTGKAEVQICRIQRIHAAPDLY